MPSTPIVTQLGQIIRAKNLSFREVERRAGLSDGCISHWMHRPGAPNLFTFQCAAEALGYRLVLERNIPKGEK